VYAFFLPIKKINLHTATKQKNLIEFP